MRVALDLRERKDGSFVCRLRKIADRYNTPAEKDSAERLFLSIKGGFGDAPDRTIVHDDRSDVEFIYERESE